MSEQGSLLRVDGLRTEFETSRGVVHAVNGVSFTVGEGEIFGIVGETGCGKSATIRSILGLIRPPGRVVAGSAYFRDDDLVSMTQSDRRKLLGSGIGFVSQHPWSALNPVMRIQRQFDTVIRTHLDLSRRERADLAESLLRSVEIHDTGRVLQGYAHQLSGGMAQRVVIALGMACAPDLVFADEPTTALDVTIQAEILDLLTSLSRSRGFSMVLVTHDLGVVANYCQRLAVMYAGRVVETGRVEDVFRTPGHPYTRALLRAIPRQGEPLEFLHGQVPDLTELPGGCAFAARCGLAQERCLKDRPELREFRTDHAAACHFVDEVAAEGI